MAGQDEGDPALEDLRAEAPSVKRAGEGLKHLHVTEKPPEIDQTVKESPAEASSPLLQPPPQPSPGPSGEALAHLRSTTQPPLPDSLLTELAWEVKAMRQEQSDRIGRPPEQGHAEPADESALIGHFTREVNRLMEEQRQWTAKQFQELSEQQHRLEAMLLGDFAAGVCNKNSAETSGIFASVAESEIAGQRSRTRSKSNFFSREVCKEEPSDSPQRPPPKHASLLRKLERLVSSPAFEAITAALITLHAVFIGALVEWKASYGDKPHIVVTVANNVLVVAFILECTIKLLALRGRFFWGDVDSIWNWFDFVLVIMTLVEVMITFWIEKGFDLKGVLKMAEMVRTLRILRIFRCIRFSPALQVILSKVFASFHSLGWVIFLLLIQQYVIAVCLTHGANDYIKSVRSLIAEGEIDAQMQEEAIQEHFGSIPRSIYTLFKSITGGKAWGDFAELLQEMPALYTVMFLVYILLTILCMLNIITGIFVDASIMSGKHDRDQMMEMERKIYECHASNLRRVFAELDGDESGSIPMDEFEFFLKNDQVKAYLASLKLDTSDATRLFNLIDEDGSGEILLDEFVDGCMRLKGEARSLDVHSILMAQHQMRRKLDYLAAEIDRRKSTAEKLLARNEAMRKLRYGSHSSMDSIGSAGGRRYGPHNSMDSIGSVASGSGPSPRFLGRPATDTQLDSLAATATLNGATGTPRSSGSKGPANAVRRACLAVGSTGTVTPPAAETVPSTADAG